MARWLSLLICSLLFRGQMLPAEAFPERPASTTASLPSFLPPWSYQVEPAFSNLTFRAPLVLAFPPGETNRLFIAERRGRVSLITNLANPTYTLFLDITSRVTVTEEGGLVGMAFHPGYSTNRYFYLFYTLTTNSPAGDGIHNRVSRFEASPEDPNRGLDDSELPLLTPFNKIGAHHGGDLHFGLDGYLYVALGEGGSSPDEINNAQRIDGNILGGIIRIDVDKKTGSLPPNPHPAISTNYTIPSDNPYIGLTQFNAASVDPGKVRTEFYAKGLRQPWRFCFDLKNGDIYCADVGGSLAEEINIIVKGGNYGAGIFEGRKKSPYPGQFVNPIQVIGQRAESLYSTRAVIGGVVYEGDRMPELKGAYIFGGWDGGQIWGLRYQHTYTVPFQLLVQAQGPITTFGTDPRNGDVLIVIGGSTIWRLVPGTNAWLIAPPQILPERLSETGIFTNLITLAPSRGFLPYAVNVPVWTDNAKVTRWFSIPNPQHFINTTLTDWIFPTGTVWVQHFEIEMTNGVPESLRRVETRILKRKESGPFEIGLIYGLTYRWDETGSDATLVPQLGMEEGLPIHYNGMIRTQMWHYPGRRECFSCHSLGTRMLGFNSEQLNRDFKYNGVSLNQLLALKEAGYFTNKLTNLYTFRVLAPLDDERFSIEYRARSYLFANCFPCHATSFYGFDTSLSTPFSQAGYIDGPLLDDSGDSRNRVVVPGAPQHSMLLQRLASLGPDRMPPDGHFLVDTQAVNLLRKWISEDLASYQSFAQWQNNYFAFTNAPAALAEADPDKDGAANYLEFLTRGHPLMEGDSWTVSIFRTGEGVQVMYPHLSNRGFEVQWSSSLGRNSTWRSLETPNNRPFFSANDFMAVVADTTSTNQSKFYRVKVYEP